MVKLTEKNTPQSELLIKEAERLWDQLKLFDTSYFSSLENRKGNVDRKHFFASQQHFINAVAYFSRPMSVLASRIDSTQARLQIIENIYEEHGEMHEESFHVNTFKKWLGQLNPNASKIEKNFPLEPCVDAFNSALMGTCQSSPIEKGICCLGIIEYMFSYISKFIATAVVDLGWISSENLIHYNLHAELDIKHSKDLFEIIDKISQPNISQCMEGIHLGAFIFSRLYSDLANLKV